MSSPGPTLSSLSFIAGTPKAAQRRSSGCPEGAEECQNNWRQQSALGGSDEELAVRRRPGRSCRTAVEMCELNREHLDGAAPSLPWLPLAEGQVAMLCLGATNAAMACPARL